MRLSFNRVTFVQAAGLALVAGLALLLAACAHTGRRPAATQQTFASRCEKAIKIFYHKVQIDGGEPRQVSLFGASLQLAQFDLPNRVRKVVADKNPSCPRNERMNALAVEMVTKSDEISNQKASLEVYYESSQELNSGTTLQDPLFARRASCVAHCQGDEISCAKECNATVKFIDEMTSSDGILSMIGYCVDWDGTTANSVETFEQLFNNYQPAILKAISRGVKESPAILARMAQVETLLTDLMPRLQEAKVSSAAPMCAAPALPTWYQDARNSIVFMQDERSIGTGFHVHGSQGELRLITAEHVFSAESEMPEFDLRIFQIARAKPPHGYQKTSRVSFKPAPGLFDRGNDIIQTPAFGNWNPLEIIPEFNVPMRGQRFHIAGFPGGSSDHYRMYDCTFLGFDRAFERDTDQVSYILECPAVPGSISGMSGGPLLDDFGRVWGVISEHSLIIGRLWVSPISRDKKGGINMGIQKIFMSDVCFRDNMLGYKRCQIMPNAYSLIP